VSASFSPIRYNPRAPTEFSNRDSVDCDESESPYLSRLIATAQAVAGVESVTVRKLQRRFAEPNCEIEDGVLPLGAKEVAQLDNDPSFPEHGKLTLTPSLIY